MTDFFQFARFGREVENLYLYSTLLRMVYQHDASLWGQLVSEIPLCTGFEDHPASASILPGWTLLRGRTGCIVVIEGTTTGLQWLLNLVGISQEPRPPFPGEVALNFHALYQNIRQRIYDAVIGGEHSNVLLCGHSLGGGVGFFLGFDFNTALSGSSVALVTEGAPKVGNLAFAQGLTYRILRLENAGDIVWTMPPEANTLAHWENAHNVWDQSLSPFFHGGAFYFIAHSGNIYSGYGEENRGGYPPLPLPITQGQIDVRQTDGHDPTEYARRLRLRLLRAPGLRRLLSPLRLTLDRINTSINASKGLDWGLDVPTGQLGVWLTEIQGPPPPSRNLCNAVDP